MIIIDKTSPHYCSIDTEAWIEDRCGQPLDYECTGEWLAKQEEHILKYLKEKTGKEFIAQDIWNPYNNENDFSNVFQMQCFVPTEDKGDWIYSNDLYCAVEIHQGTDVRANYGPVRVYGPLDGERLFEIVLSWRVEYTNGEELEESSRGEYESGYSGNPTYHLFEKSMKQHEVEVSYFDSEKRKVMRAKDVRWDEKRQGFIGWHKSGRAVVCRPFFY